MKIKKPPTLEYGIPAIEFVYASGETEVLTHIFRWQNMDGYKGIGDRAYIGTFNETQFNALIEKYMRNN